MLWGFQISHAKLKLHYDLAWDACQRGWASEKGLTVRLTSLFYAF